jgi:hypothetical protein
MTVRQASVFDANIFCHHISQLTQERNAVDLYDQRDSKGQMSFISFKEGFPKDHLVGKDRLTVKFPAYQLLHAMRSGTLETEYLD